VVWLRGPWEWFSKRSPVLENGQVESFRRAPIGSHWGAGWVLWVWSSSALEPRSRCGSNIGYHITLTRISSSFWRENKALAHDHVWVCPVEGSHFSMAQLICRPCKATMHAWTMVTDSPVWWVVRDSASQDRKRSPTGWWRRFSGLQTSAPGNDDGALSGWASRRACAQGRWWREIAIKQHTKCHIIYPNV